MTKLSTTKSFLVFLIFIILFIFAGRYFNIDPETSRNFFRQYPIALSSIIFVILYVVGTFFIWFGPKDVLRVASLFVFGVAWSTVLIYIGETLNMVTLFWFSRRLGRSFVEERAKGKIREIEEAVSHTSNAAIFFMKFYPIISFRFLDLGFGLTKISFLKYAVISLLAAPVRLYVIQYFLNVMINFGLASKFEPRIFIQRFMDMTYYLVDRPAIFLSMAIYTFSGIFFFLFLIIRRKMDKKARSEPR